MKESPLARASAAKSVGTLLCITTFEARTSPRAFLAITPDPDLAWFKSNAASKLIFTCAPIGVFHLIGALDLIE
ncbi:F-box only 18 [Gossypium arboreum]|uniref:F-box only 18 n=1 Tax=Gossypium arboreum TaxID=29729 RepID=A0A0B0PDK9_GOSAR|nr:F-box only 18 [Gossypium arboreum]